MWPTESIPWEGAIGRDIHAVPACDIYSATMAQISSGRRRTLVCVAAGALAAFGGGCGSDDHKVAVLSECPGEASYSISRGCSSSHPPPGATAPIPERAPAAPTLQNVPNRSTKTYAANPRGIKKPSNKRPANGKRLGPKALPASVVRAAPAVLALSKYRAPEPTEADLNAPAETLTPVVAALDLRRPSALSSPTLGNYAYRYTSGATRYGNVDTPASYYLYPGGSYRYCATAGSATCISGIPTVSSAKTSNSSNMLPGTGTDYAYQISQSTGYYYATPGDSYVWVSGTTSSYYYVPSVGAPEYYWAPRTTRRGYYYKPPSTKGYFWDGGGRNWSYYPERESTAHYVANEAGLVGYVNEEAMYRYEGEDWQQVQSDSELEEATAPEESFSEEQEETGGTFEEPPPASSEPEGPATPPFTGTAPPDNTPSTPETTVVIPTPAPETTPQPTVPELPPIPTPPVESPPPPQEPQPPPSGEGPEGETTQQDTPPEEPFY